MIRLLQGEQLVVDPDTSTMLEVACKYKRKGRDYSYGKTLLAQRTVIIEGPADIYLVSAHNGDSSGHVTEIALGIDGTDCPIFSQTLKAKGTFVMINDKITYDV